MKEANTWKRIKKNKKLAFAYGGLIAVVILGGYELIAYLTMDFLGLISMFLIWLPAFPIFLLGKIIPMSTFIKIVLTIVMWFLIGGWIAILKFKK